MNEIIKTGLENPHTIPSIISSGLLSDDYSNKLDMMYQSWTKTKKIGWKTAKNQFKINFDDVNSCDVDLLYQQLEKESLDAFSFAVLTETQAGAITPGRIKELEKEHVRRYTNTVEDRFHVKDIYEDCVELIRRKKESTKKNCSSYFDNIDVALDGGFKAGGIYTVMGLTGTGKSIFLTNFARSIWENDKNVLYISTEMNYTDTYERIFMSHTGETSFESSVLKYQSGRVVKPTGNIEVIKVHPHDTKPSDILKEIEKLDFKPDVLIVDYADELIPEEKGLSEYDAQGLVYAGLKTIGEMYEIPVITATQTNRSAENSDTGGTKSFVGMGAVSDSSKKVRKVDVLFSIIKTQQDKDENTLHLQIIKSRFSGHGILDFTINYNNMRITDNGIGKKQSAPVEEKKSYNKRSF